MKIRMILGCVLAWMGGLGHANTEVYQAPDAFVAEMFGGSAPSAQALWLDQDLRAALKRVLGHTPGIRVRYWAAGERTVWILEEIGKDLPITAGIAVEAGAIDEVRVLVFRESRGWEIKYPFFTKQFRTAELTSRGLSQPIDGITGATLSVRAMKRMARAALLLHQHTPHANTALAAAK